MRRSKKFFFILFLYLISFNPVNSAENIVFIDIDYVLNNSNLGKVIYKDLEEINNKNIELLNSKEKIIKEKKEAIDKTKNIVSEEQIKKDIKLFNEEVEKYKKEKDELVKKFKKRREFKLEKFLKDINPLIQEYMKDNSIDLVLEKNNIFIGNKNKEITNDIINLIDKTFSTNG